MGALEEGSVLCVLGGAPRPLEGNGQCGTRQAGLDSLPGSSVQQETWSQNTLVPSGGPEQARGCQGWWGSQNEGRHGSNQPAPQPRTPRPRQLRKDADRIRGPTSQRSGNPTDGPDLKLSLGQERPRKPQLHRESVSASSVEWDWKAKLSLGKGQFAFLAPLRLGLQAAPALPFPRGLA